EPLRPHRRAERRDGEGRRAPGVPGPPPEGRSRGQREARPGRASPPLRHPRARLQPGGERDDPDDEGEAQGGREGLRCDLRSHLRRGRLRPRALTLTPRRGHRRSAPRPRPRCLPPRHPRRHRRPRPRRRRHRPHPPRSARRRSHPTEAPLPAAGRRGTRPAATS
ncbi:MAG: hypothetical protein ACK55I_06675, partial [bacterium]